MAVDIIVVENGILGTYKVATNKDSEDRHRALAKLEFGADGVFTRVEEAVGLPVNVVDALAASRETDTLSAAVASDVLMIDKTPLVVKFFSETVAASDTDEELVAAVGSKKIRVVSLVVHVGATATEVTFESSTTTRKHKVPAGANGGEVLPWNPNGWFETAVGEALTATTGAGSAAEITGSYVEV